MTNPGSELEARVRQLRIGDRVRVLGVRADREAAKRLADMGFVGGIVLEMVRPGAPCIVRVGRAFVGLGAVHQDSLRVERLDQGPLD